jgi:hypothetical protein
MITVAETQPKTRNQFNLRAYLAGGTATSALIAAAILVFGSLAAYVAFNGLPIAGGSEGAAEQLVDAGTGTTDAPETAAAAAATAAAPGAVAATAAAPTAIPLPFTPAGPGVTGASDTPVSEGTGTAPATTPSVPGTPAGTVPIAPTAPATGTAPATTPSVPGTPADTVPIAPTAPATGAAPGTTTGGPVANAVDNVEETTDHVADLPLGETTEGVTGPVDEAVGGALNEVGGAVGQPDLGDQVGGAVDDVTGTVLP